MDAALYEKLLEELRSDLAQVAPRLQELQTVEAFLQRRLESVQDKSSYQNVLNDISAEVGTQHQRIAELERIDRFVSSQLGKPSFQLDLSAAAPLPARPVSQPTAKPLPPKPPVAKKAEPVSVPKDEDTKDEAPLRGKALAEMSGAASGMTIEFGPDGFPVHHAAGKPKSDKGAGKANIPESAGMDGATINFGPDGFPLDLPKAAPKKK